MRGNELRKKGIKGLMQAIRMRRDTSAPGSSQTQMEDGTTIVH